MTYISISTLLCNSILLSIDDGQVPHVLDVLMSPALQLAGALASALGIEAGAQADEANWVAKHAMRRHTSEEADGWKLTTAADEGAHLDSPQLSVTGPH